jgi:ATP adenylyltransferase
MSERLWAGWRMEYLRQGGGGSASGCFLCRVAGEAPSLDNLVLEVYEHTLLLLNAFPYTSGHLMVALRRHEDSLLGSGAAERAEIPAVLERARRALLAEYRPDGFNLGLNLGTAAGAGVPGHLHWHVVPRWNGDTNFMPAVAATRVLPEALSETYRRLRDALAALPPEGVQVVHRSHAPA